MDQPVEILPFTPQGVEQTKVVTALAPSLSMAGPGTASFRARRTGPLTWEAHFVRRRFWHRKMVVPRLDTPIQGTRIVFPTGLESIQFQRYKFLRLTEIVATEEHVQMNSLGPDTMVIGFQPAGRAQLDRFVRKVYYLSAEPGDGLTIEPDATCVSPSGRDIPMLPVSQLQIDYARKVLLTYLVQVVAHEQGRTVYVDQKWITPAEHEENLKLKLEREAHERRTRCY